MSIVPEDRGLGDHDSSLSDGRSFLPASPSGLPNSVAKRVENVVNWLNVELATYKVPISKRSLVIGYIALTGLLLSIGAVTQLLLALEVDSVGVLGPLSGLVPVLLFLFIFFQAQYPFLKERAERASREGRRAVSSDRLWVSGATGYPNETLMPFGCGG